jgi:hypothetical protein
MKTAGALNDRSKPELANMAKARGIRGWATMDKGALVKALAKPAAPAKTIKSAAKTTKPAKKPASKVVKVVKVAARPKPVAPVVKHATKVAPKPPAPAPKPVVKVATKTKPVAVVATKPLTNGSHKPATVVVPAKPAAKQPVPAKPIATKTLVPKPAPIVARDPVRLPTPIIKDRIILAVSNPYWLNAYWELSPNSVSRAEAALKQDWHGARLIIRLFDVTSLDTTSTSETPVKDIIVQGAGQNWYIDVAQPPRTYRADIGYVSRRGDFYVLARSNVVTPPKAGADPADAPDTGWDDKDAKHRAERILAMSTGFESSGTAELREFFEERTGRVLGPPKETAFGTGAVPPNSVKKFYFEIDAKLIVFGRTDPTAHLTLNNDPIKLNPDGTFRMTFNLPDSRQIIPAVAASADGVEERTIVLAVERNTKHLDPMIHDQMNEV